MVVPDRKTAMREDHCFLHERLTVFTEVPTVAILLAASIHPPRAFGGPENPFEIGRVLGKVEFNILAMVAMA